MTEITALRAELAQCRKEKNELCLKAYPAMDDRDALVDEMARVICKAHGEQPEQAKFYRHEASAALDIAMEEVARFTTAQAQAFRDDAHNRKQFGDNMMHKRGLAVAAYFDQHAAAIRALAKG